MRISEQNRKILQDEIDRLNKHEGKTKISVQDIALTIILQNILDNDLLPWEKAFAYESMNAITKRPYTGINRWLLPPGEYITFNQLKKYNEEHKTNYRISQISEDDDLFVRMMKKTHLIVFYNTKPPREPNAKEQKLLDSGEKVPYAFFSKKEQKWLITRPATLRYYNVFNTMYIYDVDTGKRFPQHNIQDNVKRVDGEQIIENYKKFSGVKFYTDSPGRCFFAPRTDSIHMSPIETFKKIDGLEPVVEYYNAAFHEMGHSTGMPQRLNRDSFKDYDFSKIGNKIIYSMEELVAEFTATLVLSELNIDDEIKNRVLQNSTSYIDDWFRYIFSDDAKVRKYYSGKGCEKLIYAIRQAEKAYNYIMTGNLPLSEDETETEIE